MMNIVFLDIDGVLNSHAYLDALFREFNANRFDVDEFIRRNINRTNVQFLNNLIERTDAGIVLSTNWRIVHGIQKTWQCLIDGGVKSTLVGSTPIVNDVPRAVEIATWLNANDNNNKNFVVLDDIDVLEPQSIGGHIDEKLLALIGPRFVMIDPTNGLMQRDVKRAIDVLERG